ncbi:MAG: Glu-tRNA(Gln) amidotransferase subunit GatD [Candidatus Woesearchaeota archaeon]
MAEKARPGDIVKFHLKDEIIKGTLLPRSEIMDKKAGEKIKVIKLENGYNIGVSASRIKKTEIIKKHKPQETKKVSKVSDKTLPKVLIISCGGTISSRIDYITGGVYADYTAEDFLEMMPELGNIADIDAISLLTKMSEDFTSDDWKKISRTIEKNYAAYDGFVITQGTDTLHYSSAAVSFFLEDLNKPVVFTAAQRSIDRGSSDAFMNLVSAVKFASASSVPGVYVCMHATLNDDFCHVHKGVKVRKMHSLRRDAFRSINDDPVATIDYTDLTIEKKGDLPHKDDALPDKLELKDKFEDKVAFIYFHPNMDPSIIDFYLDKGYKGFVFAGTALGHISMNGPKSFKEHIDKLKDHGIPVVMTTQCLYGRVDPLVYSTLRYLSIEGEVIFAEDMLPEVAYVKLSWLLGHGFSKEAIRSMMLENRRGEINSMVKVNHFLN